MRQLPTVFRDPGDGGGDPAKGADPTKKADPDPKADETAKQLAAANERVAKLEAAEAKRVADAAAAKTRAEDDAAKARGEFDKLLADRETKLAVAETKAAELAAREEARAKRIGALADTEAAQLPEALQRVAKAIPDPEERLDAVREMAKATKASGERPAGPGERGKAAPKVAIPADVVEEAKRYNVEPEAYYALQVRRGKIKQPVAEG